MQVRKQVVQYRPSVIYWIFDYKYRYHRDEDLPAIYYFVNKKIYSVEYVKYNKCHRTTGPALIHYEGKIKSYYYHGRQYASLEEMRMMEACR